MSDANVQVVKAAYAAYDRGGMKAVLEGFSEDIVWRNPYPAHVPMAGEFRGHEGIQRFMDILKRSCESLAFEPREFISQGDTVVVIGWEKILAKPTGRTYENAWVQLWTVRDGKTVAVRGFGDTAAVGEAFREG